MDRDLEATRLTGLPLQEARAWLSARGLPVVAEVEVSPPGDFAGSGEQRVIKTAADASGVRVYYAHRTYCRNAREKTSE